MPALINHEWIISDNRLALLLSQADIKLGELNAFSQLVPDVDFFIAMHVGKEATSSNQIEGTQTNIEEALQTVEHIDPEKRNDWEEVQNYIIAMNEAIVALERLPVSSRLLKNTHKIILQGVRQTAESAIQTFKAIIALRQTCEGKISTLKRKAKTAHKLLNYLYRCPLKKIPAINLDFFNYGYFKCYVIYLTL